MPPEDARETALHEAQTLRSFYDSATVLLGVVTLADDDIIHLSDNNATATFFGTSSEAMRGRSARAMGVPERYIRLWLEAYRASAASGEPVRFDYHHEGKGWLKVTVNAIGEGEGGRFCYVVDDITERKQAERALQRAHDELEARVRERTADLERAKAELEAANRKLQHDATHDALTGLPNRLLFTDRLAHALARYRREPDAGFTVLFMDLDHFKVINDSLGHTVGDALLVAVGQRLAHCLREADTVARLGGDEFTVLLEHCGAERAAEVVERLRRALAEPFVLEGRRFGLTGSVGVVFSEPGHEYPQDVLRDADLAMYRAKVHHSGQHAVFDPSLREGALRRLDLEADLRSAIGGGALRLHYQPIVHLSDGHLKGFEVLVRWPHPKYGPLAPDAFIPLAEETGLILHLDRYVLATACRQLAAWQAAWPLTDALSLNVNVSSQHFMRPSFVADTLGTLAAHGLSPRHLNLEITETLLMQPAASAISAVEAIMASETGLCIDDFGTGYASLSYLQRFPACTLKIDRSFVQGLGASDKGTTLVQVIIAMAQTLGMRVVAEGVETEAQRAQLKAFGCEAAQGFLFAAPLTGAEATALLAAGTPLGT